MGKIADEVFAKRVAADKRGIEEMKKERKQLYWEDVEEGQEIPGFSLELHSTQVIKQVSGGQDFMPPHHDPDLARDWGHPAPFMNTSFLQACFNRLVCSWIGDEGFLRKFRMEMRRPNYQGDTMTLKGKVTKKYVQDSDHLVDADVWIENQKYGVAVPSYATVSLPSRS